MHTLRACKKVHTLGACPKMHTLGACKEMHTLRACQKPGPQITPSGILAGIEPTTCRLQTKNRHFEVQVLRGLHFLYFL